MAVELEAARMTEKERAALAAAASVVGGAVGAVITALLKRTAK